MDIRNNGGHVFKNDKSILNSESSFFRFDGLVYVNSVMKQFVKIYPKTDLWECRNNIEDYFISVPFQQQNFLHFSFLAILLNTPSPFSAPPSFFPFQVGFADWPVTCRKSPSITFGPGLTQIFTVPSSWSNWTVAPSSPTSPAKSTFIKSSSQPVARFVLT